MKITAIRSDKVYKKMMLSNIDNRSDIYRYELMKPFEFKWKCIGVPLKSEVPGGYDVVLASTMGGGFHPREISKKLQDSIDKISNDEFWKECENSIRRTVEGFEKNGISLPVKEYIFTVILINPENPMSKMTGDYCGDGGIPGYIIGSIAPNETSIKMLPVALAHECNHNIRFQFQKWSEEINLADMIVSEGLAENFAAFMFGEDKVGIWVSKTDNETLKSIIKPKIKENLYENDFSKVSALLYGDEITKIQGETPIGMPYCAGYACGYELIRYYLKKTGKTIYEATIMPTSEILKEVEEFWS